MILDYQAQFSDAQAITATTSSTNYIDTLVAGDAVLPGAMVELVIHLALTGNTGALTATLDTSTSSDGSTGKVTLATFCTAAAIGADLGTGKAYRVTIPVGCLRYLFITYTVGSGPFTAGTVDAHVCLAGDKTLDKVL
jgi:hypothetical protein